MQINRNRSITRKYFDFRDFKEFDNHEMLISFTDKHSDLIAYIGIHNTKLGPALGGTRFTTYKSQKDAIKDVLNLSKAMTYKCALAGLPWGGGKCVIVQTKDMDTKKAFAQYAKFVQKLNGLFKTGTDVGITDEDVRYMAKHTTHMLGVTAGNRQGLSTSKVSALGLYYSILEASEFYLKKKTLKDVRVSVKGLGKIGSELLGLLHKDGAILTVADIDSKKVNLMLKKYKGISVVDSKDIHKVVADVYSPCALGHEFTHKNIKELNVRIIAGGANNQLTEDSVGDALFKQGIIYVPDYIANAGGLIYVADELEDGGFDRDRVLSRTKKIPKTLREIFIASRSKSLPPHRIANTIAIGRLTS